MYTGGEFLEEKEKLQEICQCVKAQNHFLRRIVGAGRGGGLGIVTERKPNAVYWLPCLDTDVRIK